MWTASAGLAVVLLVAAVGAGVMAAIFGNGQTGEICLATVAAPGATPGGLSAEQARNALIIVIVGERMRVPVRGWIIAVATARQESDLINRTTATDHDSLGLFQQRPSMGWGTPEQVTNPEYAAGKFYEALLRVPGWQTMPLTQAAQAVQRSAYPDAYAQHEDQATMIVKAFVGGTLPACDPVAVSAAGWTRPVVGNIVSRFRTADRPDHDGTDFAAPRNTIIRAASSGIVVTVLCNVNGQSYPPTGARLPCDSDGSPETGGCGWYTEIRHAGNVVTRYCHLVRRPAVRAGQTVTAGQPIGLVGTSGNSSGPHLHFEIHTGYPATSGNAVDPGSFLAARGVAM
jgi:murein DD-endopeptidase MepM/ murein hydrolase activator NlpD